MFGALVEVPHHAWEDVVERAGVIADPLAAAVADHFVDDLAGVFRAHVLELVADDDADGGGGHVAGDEMVVGAAARGGEVDAFDEDDLGAFIFPDDIGGIADGGDEETVDGLSDEGVIPCEEVGVFAGAGGGAVVGEGHPFLGDEFEVEGGFRVGFNEDDAGRFGLDEDAERFERPVHEEVQGVVIV